MLKIVPTSEMGAIFGETFGAALVAHGFEQVDPRKWVRCAKHPIHELFRITRLKGGSFSPVWGVSLGFVPHVSGSSIRWHRSARTAVFDLRYDPLDYNTTVGEWGVPSFNGRNTARDAARRHATMALDLAKPWFESVNSDSDLVREFEAKKQRPFVRFGFYNYVQEPLAYAFVLARVGRLTEAGAELSQYCERYRLRDITGNRLIQLLTAEKKAATHS